MGSISPSVLRSSGMRATPAACAAPRAGERNRLAVHLHRPRTPSQRAEQGQEQLALALPVEPAQPDHLARPDGEVDVLEAPRPGEPTHRRPAAPAQLRAGPRREDALDLAADHHLDDLVGPLGARREGRDVAAVAEHGAVVGELLNLVHAMGDVDDRQPLLAELLQHPKDRFHVGRGQRRGGLVEDEDAWACGPAPWRSRPSAGATAAGRGPAPADGCPWHRPARSALSASCRCARRSISRHRRRGGSVMQMLSATVRSGSSDSSWKTLTMPGPGRGRRVRRR